MTISQQKGRRVPIHIQAAVEKDVNKLTAEGHIKKLAQVGEDAFVSPVVITHKSDGTVKIALDSIELNKRIVKKTMQPPLIAEQLHQISMKISGNCKVKRYISTIDLKYAFGKIALHKETSKHCVVAIVCGKATGHYRFKKGFYGLADMPVVFQTKTDKVLNYETPAWRDNIIVVTRGTAEDHEADLTATLQKLQDHGYRSSAIKSKFSQSSTEWCMIGINEDGVSPKQGRTEAVIKDCSP